MSEGLGHTSGGRVGRPQRRDLWLPFQSKQWALPRGQDPPGVFVLAVGVLVQRRAVSLHAAGPSPNRAHMVIDVFDVRRKPRIRSREGLRHN